MFSSFAHNRGAIAGVAVGAIIAVAFAGVWIFLALRRHKKQRNLELTGSSEQVNIPPDGGWRPPLEDGDEDDYNPMRYAGLLASLGTVGHAHSGKESGAVNGEEGYGGYGGEDEEKNDRMSSEHGAGIGSSSAYSHVPPSSSGHGQATYPYMTGFGQAAETMQDSQYPMMTLANGTPVAAASTVPLMPSPRSVRTRGGPDPASWFGGKDIAYVEPSPSVVGSSSHGHSSSQHGTGSRGKDSGSGKSASKVGSSEDDPLASYPRPSSSSQLHGSSSSEVGSSSGHKRSMDAKRQHVGSNPTPPTSFSYSRKRHSSDTKSLKGIIGRLRGGRGSSSADHETTVQEASPSPSASASVRRQSTPNKSRSASPTPPPIPSSYNPIVVGVRPPTPPSSLLRPQSPSIPNIPARPTMSMPPDMREHAWSGLNPGFLTLPPLPSPAASVEEAPEGLLDPRLPWRLEQARMDSSASLRDHEDYSRPFGGVVSI